LAAQRRRGRRTCRFGTDGGRARPAGGAGAPHTALAGAWAALLRASGCIPR